jgi:hypothetical protein
VVERIPKHLKPIVHARAVGRRVKKIQYKKKHRQTQRRRWLHGPPPSEPRFFSTPIEITESRFEFPAVLDFLTLPVETKVFFAELRRRISHSRRHRVYIDHSSLKRMTPEAALVLMAEMYRAHNLFGECEKLCTLPNDPDTRDLLGGVGYYDYFAEAKKTWKPPKGVQRHFFTHQKGTLLEPLVVKSLMKHFETVSNLSAEMNSALYEALIECMNNVLEHAYPKTVGRAAQYRHWWVLGYVETGTREMSFCFFDQGVGIPRTIRTRFRDSPWLGPLARSDSELVQRAVIEGGYSSTKMPSKGRGLPTLKRFIDTSTDGELSILSHKSFCVFHTGKDPVREDHRINLPGTLITWNIRRL